MIDVGERHLFESLLDARRHTLFWVPKHFSLERKRGDRVETREIEIHRGGGRAGTGYIKNI